MRGKEKRKRAQGAEKEEEDGREDFSRSEIEKTALSFWSRFLGITETGGLELNGLEEAYRCEMSNIPII